MFSEIVTQPDFGQFGADRKQSIEELQKQVANLQSSYLEKDFTVLQKGWLDRNMQKAEVSYGLYNAEYEMHVVVYVNFFFSKGGRIWKNVHALLTATITTLLHAS